MSNPRIAVFTKFWREGSAELAIYLIARDVLSRHFDVVVMSGT